MKPLEKVIKYYNSQSNLYDEEEEQFPLTKFIDAVKKFRIRALLPKDRASWILDAGGGTGKWSIFLAEEGYTNIDLVDISDGMLKVAKKKIIERGLENKIRIQKTDVRNLPFPDNTFDFIIAEGNLLSITPRPLSALKEICRVLKRGKVVYMANNSLYGVLLYSIREKSLKDCQEIYKKRKMRIGDLDFRLYTPEELKNMLNKASLTVSSLRPDLLLVGQLDDKDLVEISKNKKVFNETINFELKLTEDNSLTSFGGQILVVARKK